MNMQVADTPVQWLFLDLNAFFASVRATGKPEPARAISALCLREGQKAWRGEECGCATCS